MSLRFEIFPSRGGWLGFGPAPRPTLFFAPPSRASRPSVFFVAARRPAVGRVYLPGSSGRASRGGVG